MLLDNENTPSKELPLLYVDGSTEYYHLFAFWASICVMVNGLLF